LISEKRPMSIVRNTEASNMVAKLLFNFKGLKVQFIVYVNKTQTNCSNFTRDKSNQWR
jgi:hypothetical protein